MADRTLLRAVPDSGDEEDASSLLSSRRCEPNIIEVSTTGYDPDAEGIDATWLPGSPHASRLFIPQAPTLARNERYTFILCGHRVPAGETHEFLGFRQKLTIGAEITQGQNDAAIRIIKEIPVETPDWRFEDGNVVWGFRWIPGDRPTVDLGDTGTNPGNQGPSQSQNPYATYSALLFVDSAFVRYIPPASGQPPGEAIEGMPDFYDVRNAWNVSTPPVRTILRGAGQMIMIASVRQSNIATRNVWTPAADFDLGAIAKEDRFRQAFSNALYRHIAGAMTFRMLR